MGIDIRKAVMEFHEKYYSSNIMTLAILGRESLDELQVMAEKIFLEVPNRNATVPTWPTSPYNSEHLQTKIEVVPVKDVRSMAINFPIPYEAINDYKASVRRNIFTSLMPCSCCSTFGFVTFRALNISLFLSGTKEPGAC